MGSPTLKSNVKQLLGCFSFRMAMYICHWSLFGFVDSRFFSILNCKTRRTDILPSLDAWTHCATSRCFDTTKNVQNAWMFVGNEMDMKLLHATADPNKQAYSKNRCIGHIRSLRSIPEGNLHMWPTTSLCSLTSNNNLYFTVGHTAPRMVWYWPILL